MTPQDKTLSAAEKKAVRERARELKASQKKDKLEQAVLAAIEEMPPAERRSLGRCTRSSRRWRPA